MDIYEAKKIKATFHCDLCGYEDYVGSTEICPVCDPEAAEKGAENSCFFLNMSTELCHQDNTQCPYTKSKSFEDCPKLQAPVHVKE